MIHPALAGGVLATGSKRAQPAAILAAGRLKEMISETGKSACPGAEPDHVALCGLDPGLIFQVPLSRDKCSNADTFANCVSQ